MIILLIVIEVVIVGTALACNTAKYQPQGNWNRCPKCKSTDIIKRRKGYDWERAGVYELLGFGRDGRVLAGMHSNDTVCLCNNCGHKWTTYEDARFIR